MENSTNKVRKEVSTSKVYVSKDTYISNFQKEGRVTAELKQTITTTSFYPKKSISNSLQDNLYSAKEFNIDEEKHENVETRVAWIDVPEGTTRQQVQDRLDKAEKATLYKVLSNRPITSTEDNYNINNNNLPLTLDTFANKQAIRYPIKSEKAGQLVLDGNNKIQYRRIAFSTSFVEDVDKRTEDPQDFYISEKLSEELSAENQTDKHVKAFTIEKQSA